MAALWELPLILLVENNHVRPDIYPNFHILELNK